MTNKTVTKILFLLCLVWAVIATWLAVLAHGTSRKLKTQLAGMVEHRLNYQVCIRNISGAKIENIQIHADGTMIDAFSLDEGSYKLVEFKPEQYRTLVVKSGHVNSQSQAYATKPVQLETLFFQDHSFIFSAPTESRYMPGLDFCMLYKPWFETLENPEH